VISKFPLNKGVTFSILLRFTIYALWVWAYCGALRF